MGLLDSITGSSIDDPKTTGLLALASALSSGPKFMPALANGLLARQQVLGDARREQTLAQMQAIQLQQVQQQQAKQQALMDAARASSVSPEQAALAGGGGPTVANAEKIATSQPGFDWKKYQGLVSGIDPMMGLQVEAATRKDSTPLKLAAGEAIVDPKTFKPIYTNPKEDTTPSAVKEYNFAVAQGYQGSFQQFQLEQKRAGAPSVSVSMDKGFGTTFADNAAKDLGASRDKARAAVSTINTLNNIDRLIDTGKVATGPTQPFQVYGMQIAEGLGVGGKSNAEKLANTRQVIQSAANLSLDGAARMAGQGQITEGERALIRDAAGGGIDRMTPPEIKALTGALRKVNQNVVAGHQSLLNNVGPQFKQFTPFYQVNSPAADAPASNGLPMVDQSAIDAEIQRRLKGQ